MPVNPLTQLTKMARSALGAPKLLAAATRAGVGPRDAVQAMAASALALEVAARRGAGEPGRQNAVRHFIWQAHLTGRYGVRLAQALAEAQESGTPDSKDSAVDQRNNAVARAYGLDHAEEIRQGSARQSLERLADVALVKWSAGELVWVRPRRSPN